jgi:hypothetical protein
VRFTTLRVLSRSRLGHRGGVLLILGLFDVIYGWSLASPAGLKLAPGTVDWLQEFAPVWLWGCLWIIIGFVLIGAAWTVRDMVGYTCAIGIKVAWGLVTIASWAVGDVSRGWATGSIWLAFASMVAVISGWPEPVKTTIITAQTLSVIDIPDDGDGEATADTTAPSSDRRENP